jgi:hypothetical protein
MKLLIMQYLHLLITHVCLQMLSYCTKYFNLRILIEYSYNRLGGVVEVACLDRLG